VEKAKAAVDDRWLADLSDEDRATLGKVNRCPDCGLNFGTGE